MKGTIALFKGPREPFELRDYTIPDVGPDDVLARVTMAMICGSDLHYWRGDLKLHAVETTGAGILGHEMVGRIDKLGKNVKTDSRGTPIKEGDRITYTYFVPCHSCPQCLRGAVSSCGTKRMFTDSIPGEAPYFTAGFGEYFYLSKGYAFFKVPDELPDSWVAPANCSFAQVYFGLHAAGLRTGESCVIQGAGGLGLYAAAVAREMGASPVIVIDGIETRLVLAKEFGADEVISLARQDTMDSRVARVRELVGPAGADVVVEVVGLPSAFIEGVRMTRTGGRYLVLGQIFGGEKGTIPFKPAMLFGKNVVSAGAYDLWALPGVLDFMVRYKDRYPFQKMVSHRYPLRDITRAFQDSEWLRPESTQLPVTRTAILME